MRLESYRRRPPALNVSALVDVLFILVVFVTLAARFDQPRALEVELPGSDTAAASEPSLRLEVPLDGPLRLGGEPVAEAELENRLRAARAEHRALLIAAHRAVPLERATHLLDAAARAGFTAVSLATEPR